MQNSKVICFGEALVDRIGPCGGDPKFDKPVQDCLGGAPANVACALARLGRNVSFVGCLGDDLFGVRFRELFDNRAIDDSALQINHSLPTRVVLVRRDLQGERSFEGFEGDLGYGFADQFLNIDELIRVWPQISQNASWFLAGTIPLASDTSRKALLWSLDKAHKQGLHIAIDINWRPTLWGETFSSETPPNGDALSSINKVLENASLIKLAKEEAIWFFKTDNPLQISKRFDKRPSVIVTNGSHPIKWLLGGFYGEFEVFTPPELVDTTGAGDSFTAGLISRMLLSFSTLKTFDEAEGMVRFAAACGALVCTGPGAIDPQPKPSQVESFLSKMS